MKAIQTRDVVGSMLAVALIRSGSEGRGDSSGSGLDAAAGSPLSGELRASSCRPRERQLKEGGALGRRRRARATPRGRGSAIGSRRRASDTRPVEQGTGAARERNAAGGRGHGTLPPRASDMRRIEHSARALRASDTRTGRHGHGRARERHAAGSSMGRAPRASDSSGGRRRDDGARAGAQPADAQV